MNRISCIMLAAGQPSPVNNQAVVRKTAMDVLNIPFEEMIVVTGPDSESVSENLRDLPLRVVFNREYESSRYSSIRAGLSQLRKYQDGCFICSPEQSQTDSKVMEDMVRVFRSHNGKKIVYPNAKGGQGQPVLVPREFIPEILLHEGDDFDCSDLLKKYPQRIVGMDHLNS